MESIDIRLDQTEEKICEVEDKSFEIIQSEKNKEKRMKRSDESLCELWGTIKRNSLHYCWSPR